MKKAICLLTLCAVISGCTGSFELTKQVYKFHREQEGKWMDEVVFLGCAILPVYGLATLGDAIIFNVVEFWTDENPLVSQATQIEDITCTKQADGTVLFQGEHVNLELTKSSEGVQMKTQDGQVYTAKTNADGSLVITDLSGKVVKTQPAS